VGFTRYYGTCFADVPLEVVFAFSNEDTVAVPDARLAQAKNPMNGGVVVADGRLPESIRGVFPVTNRIRETTEEDLRDLHYDGIALVSNYLPAKEGKPAVGRTCLVTIYGCALSVTVRNVGTVPLSECRFHLRGSVF